MKVGMALKRTKVKLRQQEGTKNAKSPQFKHRERRLGRFKKIITSAIGREPYRECFQYVVRDLNLLRHSDLHEILRYHLVLAICRINHEGKQGEKSGFVTPFTPPATSHLYTVP